jgi:hypothetical protein
MPEKSETATTAPRPELEVEVINAQVLYAREPDPEAEEPPAADPSLESATTPESEHRG